MSIDGAKLVADVLPVFDDKPHLDAFYFIKNDTERYLYTIPIVYTHLP